MRGLCSTSLHNLPPEPGAIIMEEANGALKAKTEQENYLGSWPLFFVHFGGVGGESWQKFCQLDSTPRLPLDSTPCRSVMGLNKQGSLLCFQSAWESQPLPPGKGARGEGEAELSRAPPARAEEERGPLCGSTDATCGRFAAAASPGRAGPGRAVPPSRARLEQSPVPGSAHSRLTAALSPQVGGGGPGLCPQGWKRGCGVHCAASCAHTRVCVYSLRAPCMCVYTSASIGTCVRMCAYICVRMLGCM